VEKRIPVCGELRQKLARPYFKSKLGMVVLAWVPTTLEVEVGGSRFKASLGKSTKPI
jgi:hypothetical protein